MPQSYTEIDLISRTFRFSTFYCCFCQIFDRLRGFNLRKLEQTNRQYLLEISTKSTILDTCLNHYCKITKIHVLDTARSEITSIKLLHTAQLSELHAKHEENLANLKSTLVSQFNERTQDCEYTIQSISYQTGLDQLLISVH